MDVDRRAYWVLHHPMLSGGRGATIAKPPVSTERRES